MQPVQYRYLALYSAYSTLESDSGAFTLVWCDLSVKTFSNHVSKFSHIPYG